MAKFILVQVYDSVTKATTWEKIAATINSSNEIIFDRDKLCEQSGTKTWQIKIDDEGTLSTSEVV